MPWDYAEHKSRLHADEVYKTRFYGLCRKWLKKKLANDDVYALKFRIKRRIQARKRRKRQKQMQLHNSRKQLDRKINSDSVGVWQQDSHNLTA